MQTQNENALTPPRLPDDETVHAAVDQLETGAMFCSRLTESGHEEATRAAERIAEALVYLENLAKRLATPNTSPA